MPLHDEKGAAIEKGTTSEKKEGTPTENQGVCVKYMD